MNANARLLIGIFLGVIAISAVSRAPARAETTAPEDKSIQAVIEEYCTAVSDQAGEQRIAREKQALNELQLKVEKRLNDLEKAKNELQEQLDRREELRNLAKKELVEIYAGMDPAAAAAQMDKVDMRLASSIIRQLKPRQASAILDEMRPELAAKLVRYIAIATATEEPSN
jgi:flagellar motility protein MotE (MotC chaperone)